MADLDAVVIGSGPNGLAAAIALARAGRSVAVFEAAGEVGGGTRSAELTLPGFTHDVCSAVHPMGILSPFFRELPLAEHGLVWLAPRASVAHPLDDGPAVMIYRSLERTAAGLGADGARYARLVGPFLDHPHELLADVMAPLRIPDHPIAMLRFGLRALFPASWLARLCFRGERARALFAGCAAHSVLPLSQPFTAALGLLFAITAHVEDWPVAQGGSHAITRALASYLSSLGGAIETNRRIERLDELPPARAVLFDTSPDQLSRIAGDALPAATAGVSRAIATAPAPSSSTGRSTGRSRGRTRLPRGLDRARRRHARGDRRVGARHVPGRHAERPFLILCQQSELDPTRAPAGQHTGYAYCHVPHGSTLDRTDAIEAQVERFAPGFRDRILARHAMNTAWFERYNPNYVGGAITGGVADALQLFNRPVTRLDPYATPNPRLFICSAATPPGGGVHGMCGYWAAQSALKRL